jgi:PAS domain S-box-containing protein
LDGLREIMMFERSQYTTVKNRKILFFGLAIALVFWIAEGLRHCFIFDSFSFANILLPSNIHELWMRSLIVCTFVGFSVYTQLIVNRLYETSQRYRILFENAPDAIFIADSESGVISDANPAASQLLLRPHNEIVGLHQTQLHPPVKKDDSTRIFNVSVERSKQKKKAQPVDYVVLRSDGMEVPVEIVAKTANIGDRSILQGIFRDITERKEAEAELRESEQRFHTIFDNAADGILVADAESKQFYMANNLICQMLGYDQKELTSLGMMDIHHEQDLPYVVEQFEKQVRGELTLAKDIPVKRKDGSVFYADISSFPIQLDGKTYLMGVFRDISERKKAEEELKESEEKYRALVENAVETIVMVDENGVFLFMNTRAANNLGGKPEDYIGKTMWDLFPKEIADRQAATVRETINTGRGINRIISSEVRGKLRWYNASVEPLRDSHGKVASAMIMAHDITEIKRVQEELERYRREMARAERLASMGTLSATAAHELTQPLTVVSLLIENALDKLVDTSCPMDVSDKLKNSLAEISHITSIVERFRSFARRSSEKVVREVDLQAVGERIVNLLGESAQLAKVTLRLEGVDKLPHIYSNEKDLEQLFFALVDNTIGAGDGKKSRQLVISGALKDEHIELKFSDNCGGIAPENLDKIFEPFFTTKPADQGTGLGLCIVRDIVSRAGGKIRVESKFGEGSTFFVTLPINKDVRL